MSNKGDWIICTTCNGDEGDLETVDEQVVWVDCPTCEGAGGWWGDNGGEA